MKYKYHCRNCGCDFNEFKQVDYGAGLGDYVNCCPDCFSENYEKNSISMTEQEYMKLVMLHKEKQKEAEDEACLIRKENERLLKTLQEIRETYKAEGYGPFIDEIAAKALEGKE